MSPKELALAAADGGPGTGLSLPSNGGPTNGQAHGFDPRANGDEPGRDEPTDTH
jgi:hypothetical protein